MLRRTIPLAGRFFCGAWYCLPERSAGVATRARVGARALRSSTSTWRSSEQASRAVARRALVLTVATGAAIAGCGNDEAARTVTTTVPPSPPATATAASEDQAANSTQTEDPENELRFSGGGDRSLPPFRVRRGGAILRWTNSGEVFSLFGSKGTVVDSVASQGKAFLPAGVHRIDVVASGRWVIRIPRAGRLR